MKCYHFIIWGTGHNAGLVCDYLKMLDETIKGICIVIDYFVDSDSVKWNEKYKDYIIKSPAEYFDDKEKASLIISLNQDGEVVANLRRNSINKYYTVDALLNKEKFFDELMEEGFDVYDTTLDIYQRHIYRMRAMKCLDYTIDNFKVFVGVALSEFGDDLKKAKLLLHKNNCTTRGIDNHKIGIYYNRLYNGGIERVISYHLAMFINSGYKVVLFIHEISEEDYTIPNGIERCVIPYEPACPYIWLAKMYDEIEKRNIGIFINHAHTVERSFYLSFCLDKLGVRNIIISHTCKEALDHLGIDRYKIIYETADTLVTLSKSDEVYWKKNGVNSVYIPNPVKTDLKKRNAQHNNIIWVGRIDEKEKHIFAVIPLMKKLKTINSNIKLTIIGKADEPKVANELIRRIKSENLTDSIFLRGYVNDIDSIYKTAEVIIMTSYYEGFPMVVAESMRYGIPLIMFKINNLEIINGGKGYIEVEFDDYDAMAKAINNVVNNKELQDKMSFGAKESIERFAKIDISKMWEAVISG